MPSAFSRYARMLDFSSCTFSSRPRLSTSSFSRRAGVAASLADVIVELRQLTLRQAAAHFLDHICKGFQLASCIFQLGEFLRTAEYIVERQAGWWQ